LMESATGLAVQVQLVATACLVLTELGHGDVAR
jgi:hypothetical protein